MSSTPGTYLLALPSAYSTIQYFLKANMFIYHTHHQDCINHLFTTARAVHNNVTRDPGAGNVFFSIEGSLILGAWVQRCAAMLSRNG